MLFRRTSHTSARRRRVLFDALLGSYVLGVPTIARRRTRPSYYVGRSRNYGSAAFLEVQARLTDLVPVHPLALLSVFAAGLGLIAGLLELYLWTLRAGPAVGHIAALDLAVRGSLATWFASAALAAAALAALVVFSVRRYRLDDYHGHYRVWLWAAACWLLLSIDATANLHEAFGALMVWVTGTRLFGDASIWWLVVGGFLVGGIGTRLLVDMRHCRLSSAALVVSGACCASCIGFHFGWIPAERFAWLSASRTAKCVVLYRVAFLGGSFLLLMAMLWHARYVILDAEGLLPRRRYARRRHPRDIESALAEEEAMLDDVTPVTVLPPRGVSRSTVVTPVVSQPVVTPVVSGGSATGVKAIASSLPLASSSGRIGLPVQRTLTKQEKKALRRRLEQARQERERRAG
jgi:hypothetical protein